MRHLTEYTTLVGQDVQIAQNQFTASAAITLEHGGHGADIEAIHLKLAYAGAGGGAALHPAGTLYFFRSNPTVAAATASNGLTEAQVNLIVGEVGVGADDWADLAVNICELALLGVYASDVIKIPNYPTLYVAFLYEGATTINSAAGDQEVLSIRVVYS